MVPKGLTVHGKTDNLKSSHFVDKGDQERGLRRFRPDKLSGALLFEGRRIVEMTETTPLDRTIIF